MSLEEARQEIRKTVDNGEYRLILGGMNLTELPPEVFQLTHLSHLYIERNQLTTIPPEIGMLTNLEELYIQNNRLSTLPPEIGLLTRLKLLTLMSNEFVELPPEIGKLKELESLGLRGNKLAGLPPEIGQLVNLKKVLALDHNLITTLPAEIGNLVHLESLDVSNNQLTALPAEIGNLVDLKSLSLQKNQLTALPSAVGRLRHLTELRIQDNRLVSLPSEIGKLTGLKSLHLENNSLSRLPSEVGHLVNLESMYLQNNQLTALPSEVGDLVNLKFLHLQNNNLARLPSEIGQLINLKGVYLENNQLIALPPEIGDLANLHELFLQNNNLTKLPQEVARLDKLRTLRLQEDQLFPLPVASRVRDWDVFISHASEDKDAVALPLAHALMAAGLTVWIDKQEIQIGDSIREKIDVGLSKSRFGVVILSQSFLDKVWTQRELNGLMAIEDDGEKVVLPVWHNISKATLGRYSPILSDRAAANTQDGIPAVASQIIDVVLYQANDSPSTLFPNLTRRLVQTVRKGSPTGIRDFLIQHERIIYGAFGEFRWGLGQGKLTLSPRLLGQQTPSILAKFESDGTFVYKTTAYLVFASPDTRLLGEEYTSPGSTSHERSILESGRTLILNEPEWKLGVFVAGRRGELTEIAKTRLNDFNQANEDVSEESSESPRSLRIRTYDWLIDACVLLERRGF